MALTAVQIKNAKPREKVHRLKDFDGLFLEVRTSGAKCWRFRGTYNGKEILLSLGVFPDVSLATARERCRECREQLAAGINPSLKRKEDKAALTGTLTFEDLAREWHERTKSKWSATHADKILYRLERELFPYLGRRPANDVTPKELLSALRVMENRRAIDLAHRMHQIAGQVFRYGIATGRVDRDSAADLRGALTPRKPKHHASLTDPKEIAQLMRAIDGYQGTHVVRCALRLSPLLFVRPGELRHMEWSEIDADTKEWRIPAGKMKMKVQHIVPLSTQALAILDELRPLTGDGKYAFPGRTASRPMSENTIGAALRYLGYSTREQQTAHGFRSMASTLLNEMGWNRDAIERQLAHAERDGVRAAYNYAEYLPERKRMMQAWADYLDALRENGRVIPLHHAMNGAT